MTRKEFLGLIGSTAIIGCLGCSKKDLFVTPSSPQGLTQGQNTGHTDTTTPQDYSAYRNDNKVPPASQKLDISIPLNQPQFAPLLQNGSYVYFQQLIIARTLQGNYIAASEYCTHNGVSLEYSEQSNQYWCPAHGSKFTNEGTLLNGPAQKSLKTYKTQLNDQLLRVYEE